jgi:predicted transcriptional regulator
MKDVKLSIKVNERMAERLKDIATRQDSNLSQIVRNAINLYFQKETKDK